MSSSAFWTFQHGCPPNLARTFLQRCSLIAIVTSLSIAAPTIRRCARSFSTTTAPLRSRIFPSRTGGFAERVDAQAWVDVPDALGDAHATAVEPLACVLRGIERVPRGRVLVVGFGFIGRLFAAVLERRGDEVFAVDADPRRAGR